MDRNYELERCMHTRRASFARYLSNILNFLGTLLSIKKSLKCRGSLTFFFFFFFFLPIIVHSTKHFVQLWARYVQNSSYTIQLSAVSVVFQKLFTGLPPPRCVSEADGPPGLWASAVLRKPTPTLRLQDHPPPLVTHVIVMLWHLAEITLRARVIERRNWSRWDRWHLMARRVGIKQQERH